MKGDRCYLVDFIPFNFDGGKFSRIWHHQDITYLKRIEENLAAEREQLAITLRSINDGVITTDTQGNIVTINKTAELLTGWTAKQALGMPLPAVLTIVKENTHNPCDNPSDIAMRTGTVVELGSNICLISKDNAAERLISLNAAPLKDGKNRIIGSVLFFRDITQKQKLNDSMQRAQKLESLGVLAGGIAHDFNNLLSGIFGYLQMAKICFDDNNHDKGMEFIQKASGVFERAKGLTQQLLTFSKGGSPKPTTMSLKPIIEKNAQFALSGSNVLCQFDIPDSLWLCDVDENQISQVIDNIVINAKQAMPLGGTIVLSAKNITVAPEHRIVPQKQDNFVCISIRDTGIGIPKELLPRIFDPFFSTKQTGHGLGLATVYSIVQRHNGWIDVESEPGKGTTFYIILPASQHAPLHHVEPRVTKTISATERFWLWTTKFSCWIFLRNCWNICIIRSLPLKTGRKPVTVLPRQKNRGYH